MEASHEISILRKTSILNLEATKCQNWRKCRTMLVLILQRVSSRVSGFPVASPCLWGKLQNLSFSKVSKQVVMSFCVAGAILLRSFALFSQDELHFSRQAQTLETSSIVMLRRHLRRVALRALHSTLHTPPFTLHTPYACVSTSVPTNIRVSIRVRGLHLG